MADNSKDSSDPKKLRTRQEVTVLAGFTRALQNQVEQIRGKIGANGGNLGISDRELQALNSLLYAGNMEGLIAGVATFVFLRRFPKYLRQRVARRAQQQGGGGYTLDAPSQANSPFHNTNKIQQNPMSRRQNDANPGGLIWRSFQFTLDLAISLLVGLQTAAYFADYERMKRTITEIPLMEGRSGISDHFCGVLVEEYKKQWKYDPSRDALPSTFEASSKTTGKPPLTPFDRKDILQNPQLDLLKAMTIFIENCRKRQALERRIRQESGMKPDEPVPIPSPGVVSASSEWTGSDDTFGDDGDFSGGDFYSGEKYLSGDDEEGDEWSKEDVSNLVSDQEDDSKK